MDCRGSQAGEVNRNEKITIALSLLLALSAMAGCSVHRNYYGWERRRQEQKCCSHATVTLFKRISDECMIAKAWPCNYCTYVFSAATAFCALM